MSEHTELTQIQTIRIWQQNLNRSQMGQQETLNTITPNSYDIMAIQEPWKNSINHYSTATSAWRSVYPTTHNKIPAETRSLLLVSTNLSTNSWSELSVDSPDITAIQLQTKGGLLWIFNMYVDCLHDEALKALETTIREHRAGGGPGAKMIWVGDFNRHHPLWDAPSNHHLFTRSNIDAADTLINLTRRFRMTSVLPAGIPTLCALSTNNLTRVDQVYASESLADEVTKCNTHPEAQPTKVDHYPIATEIDRQVERTQPKERRDFRKVDWEEFGEQLEGELKERTRPVWIADAGELESAVQSVMGAIEKTVTKCVPTFLPTPFRKRWWTKELTALGVEKRKLQRRAAKYRRMGIFHEVLEEARLFRNDYNDRIEREKRTHWTNYLDEATVTNVHQAARYAKGPATDGGRSRIAALEGPQAGKRTVTDNGEKGKLFYKAFFIEPADPKQLRIPPSPAKTSSAFEYTPITTAQVHRAIQRLAPYKAPGPNGVPNVVYTKNREVLAPILADIFRASMRYAYWPTAWRASTTVVLKKPGKPDYSKPKAYRPITLKDTMAKIMTRCVAEDLAYYGETKKLLPANHFGARAGRTATDALHYVTAWTRAQLRKKKVVTLTILDIKSAFPSTDSRRLLHELRTRGVPPVYTKWIETMLANRKTRLSFDDFLSEEHPVSNGLEQGCPLSPVLFLYYSAPLIDSVDNEQDAAALSFVDDLGVLTAGKTFQETHRHMEVIYHRPGGYKEWSETRNAFFETDKGACLDFTYGNSQGKGDPIKLGDDTITPSKSHKYLGVHIDDKLSGKTHAAYTLAKGTQRVGQIARLSGITKGIRAQHLRTLYYTTVVPSMLYAADVFIKPFVSQTAKGRAKGSIGIANNLQRVQRQMALRITGAMRSTPTDVLFAHTGMWPIRQLINKLNARAASRLASRPASHPIYLLARQAANNAKRHRSPMHELFSAFDIRPALYEKIEPFPWSPKTRERMTVSIATSREEAVSYETALSGSIRLYSDGSGYEGKIAASAAVFDVDRREPLWASVLLGTEDEHTVYEAEVVGMALAVHLAAEHTLSKRTPLGVDNQAALQCLQLSGAKPGEHLVQQLAAEIKTAQSQRRGFHIKGYWTPGHQDIEGNEFVDDKAKDAASHGTKNAHLLPSFLRKPLPLSISAKRQSLNAMIKLQAQQTWLASAYHERTVKMDSALGPLNDSYLKIITRLSKNRASLITQLRTGHVGLNRHLHKMNRSDTPHCPNCPGIEETVLHYVIQCPAYDHLRGEMRRLGNREARCVNTLLGKPKNFPLLLRYVDGTERLKETFGDVTMKDWPK